MLKHWVLCVLVLWAVPAWTESVSATEIPQPNTKSPVWNLKQTKTWLDKVMVSPSVLQAQIPTHKAQIKQAAWLALMDQLSAKMYHHRPWYALSDVKKMVETLQERDLALMLELVNTWPNPFIINLNDPWFKTHWQAIWELPYWANGYVEIETRRLKELLSPLEQSLGGSISYVLEEVEGAKEPVLQDQWQDQNLSELPLPLYFSIQSHLRNFQDLEPDEQNSVKSEIQQAHAQIQSLGHPAWQILFAGLLAELEQKLGNPGQAQTRLQAAIELADKHAFSYLAGVSQLLAWNLKPNGPNTKTEKNQIQTALNQLQKNTLPTLAQSELKRLLAQSLWQKKQFQAARELYLSLLSPATPALSLGLTLSSLERLEDSFYLTALEALHSSNLPQEVRFKAIEVWFKLKYSPRALAEEAQKPLDLSHLISLITTQNQAQVARVFQIIDENPQLYNHQEIEAAFGRFLSDPQAQAMLGSVFINLPEKLFRSVILPLRNSPTIQVRQAVLSLWREHAQLQDLELLIPFLTDPDTEVNRAALQALAKIPHPRVKEINNGYLKDTHSPLYKTALTNLIHEGDWLGLLKYQRPIQPKQFLRLFQLKPTDLAFTQAEVEAAKTILADGPPALQITLLNYLRQSKINQLPVFMAQAQVLSSDPQLAEASVLFLVECDVQPVGSHSFLRYLDNDNLVIRLRVLEKIDPNTLPPEKIKKLVEDPDPYIQTRLLDTLFVHWVSLEMIEKGIQSNDPTYQDAAWRALAKQPYTQALPLVQKYLQGKTNRDRRKSLDTLNQMIPKDQSALLKPLLQDADGIIRALALAGMTRTNGSLSKAELLVLLNDSDIRVKIMAAEFIASRNLTDLAHAMTETLFEEHSLCSEDHLNFSFRSLDQTACSNQTDLNRHFINSLAKLEPDTFPAKLLEYLLSQNPKRQVKSLELLQQFPQAIPFNTEQIQALAKSSNPKIQAAIQIFLTQEQAPSFSKALSAEQIRARSRQLTEGSDWWSALEELNVHPAMKAELAIQLFQDHVNVREIQKVLLYLQIWKTDSQAWKYLLTIYPQAEREIQIGILEALSGHPAPEVQTFLFSQAQPDIPFFIQTNAIRSLLATDNPSGQLLGKAILENPQAYPQESVTTLISGISQLPADHQTKNLIINMLIKAEEESFSSLYTTNLSFWLGQTSNEQDLPLYLSSIESGNRLQKTIFAQTLAAMAARGKLSSQTLLLCIKGILPEIHRDGGLLAPLYQFFEACPDCEISAEIQTQLLNAYLYESESRGSGYLLPWIGAQPAKFWLKFQSELDSANPYLLKILLNSIPSLPSPPAEILPHLIKLKVPSELHLDWCLARAHLGDSGVLSELMPYLQSQDNAERFLVYPALAELDSSVILPLLLKELLTFTQKSGDPRKG
ncbi:MAG: HEAT repeat domain-containing protein [Candidatus Sericytochromatia bacterium]|nr:HEAT repeat domain-containing protein [Candidatus Sericytochromatia bacterium]